MEGTGVPVAALAFGSFVTTCALLALAARLLTWPFLKRLRAGMEAHGAEEEAATRLAALGLTVSSSESLRRRAAPLERIRWVSDGLLVLLGVTTAVVDLGNGSYAALPIDAAILGWGLIDGVREQIRWSRTGRSGRQ